MKRFWGFIKKEFFHITRDYRTMAILFGMPIVQLLLFGYVITNEIKDIKVAVFDQSKDVNTRKITDKLLSTGYFKMYDNIDQLGNIEKIFRKGTVKEVIVYEKDFTRKLETEGKASIQIIADASEPNTANLIVNYTSGIIGSYNKDLNKTMQQPDFIKPEVRMYYNSELKGVYMFVPGLMALLLTLISALMTSISITREKELGTMEVLLVSPMKPFQIIVGKVIPYVLMSFINAAMILLISNLVFEVPIRGSVVLLLAECTLYIMVALSLGILISTTTNSQQVAMLMSMVGLMLPAILLSGFIFPIENMPVVLQGICQIMPPRWFITIIKAIMLKGVGLSYVWKETAVLFIMMAVFIGLSVKKFKVRLE